MNVTLAIAVVSIDMKIPSSPIYSHTSHALWQASSDHPNDCATGRIWLCFLLHRFQNAILKRAVSGPDHFFGTFVTHNISMAVNGQDMAQDQISFGTLLRENDLGIIENPLRRIAKPDLIEHV
jgi:hypothetical protein